MNKYTEQDGNLYYGDTLVAMFVPEIKQIDVLRNQITNTFDYEYHVSIKTKMSEHAQEKVFGSLNNIPFNKYWKECAGSETLSAKQRKLLNGYLTLCVKSARKKEIPCLGCIRNYDKTNAHAEWSELADYLFNMLSIKKGETEILLLCKIAAILKPLFEEANCSMDFYVLLYGKSGLGKTTLAKLFFCQEQEQCKSFKLDNQTTIKKSLEKYQGNTVLVDDYHPEALDYGRKKQNSLKDLISRMADRAGTAMTIVTAEFREGTFSTQDREVQIEISDTQIQWELFEQCRQHSDLYQVILHNICRAIYENRETIQKMIINSRKETGEFRISHNVGILKTVVDIVYVILDKIPMGEILRKKMPMGFYEKEYLYRLLDELEAKQKQSMKLVRKNGCEMDWIRCFYDMVYTDGIFHRIPIDNLNKAEKESNCIYSDGDEICIPEMTLIDGVIKYFNCSQEQIAEARKMKRKLIDELKREKILLKDASASDTKKKKGKRCYIVDRKRLELFCQNYK